MGVVLLAAMAAGLVQIEGAGSCPSPAAVTQKLALLLPEGSDADPRDSARIDAVDGGLRLELRSPSSTRVAVRQVPGGRTCDQLASVAAVMIAAWESELRPAALAAPLLPPEPLPATASATGPASVVRAARPPRGLDLEVDAAFVMSLAGAAFAPGASADVSLRPRDFGLGGRLGVRAFGTRELALSGGSFAWTRASLALGASYRLGGRRWRVDLHAELLPALLSVKGAGFDRSHQAFDFDLGLGGGVRVGVRAGPVTPYLGAGVVGWLRQEVAEVTGSTETVEVPRFEVLLDVGLAVGASR